MSCFEKGCRAADSAKVKMNSWITAMNDECQRHGGGIVCIGCIVNTIHYGHNRIISQIIPSRICILHLS